VSRPTYDTWTCAQCGEQNTDGRTTCGNCGYYGRRFPRPATADTRQGAAGAGSGLDSGRVANRAQGHKEPPYGKCPHTGRNYRSKTERRWAAEHRQHWYEPLTFWTPCGRYTPDFACGPNLYEIKGSWIRDRALHKVKAALRVVKEFGFDGVRLAQWDGKRWDVSEIKEG
jgi:hypothetical protein